MTKKIIDPSKTYRTRHGCDVRNITQRTYGAYQDTDYKLYAEVCSPKIK